MTEDLSGAPVAEVTDARESLVGATKVRRALPMRHRRTVGPWCFEDHMGPTHVTPTAGLDVGPHPHIGLQTVTWLTEGEILHKDSLGTEQLIRPGQVNLMTAGTGVVHSEEATGSYAGRLQGVQLWVAQPEATRHTEPAFEHHATLPITEAQTRQSSRVRLRRTSPPPGKTGHRLELRADFGPDARSGR